MTYSPNFSDPRVIRRCRRALGFLVSHLHPRKPKLYSRDGLDRYLGKSSNPLSAYIRAECLTCVDTHYNMETGKPKRYLLNLTGFDHIQEAIGLVGVDPKTIAVRAMLDIHGDTIRSGNFKYKDKSHRRWNSIQNISSEIRGRVFADCGYAWNYDIENAAPTLLHQYARSCGLNSSLHTIEDLLVNKHQRRQELANRIGCDVNNAKQIIAARFAGATLRWGNSLHTQTLHNNNLQFGRLKDDVWFADLSEDLRKLWIAIKSDTPYTRLTARHKWGIYFSLERSVINSCERVIKRHKCQYFLEHDGFRTNDYIDPYKFKLEVKKQTGYNVDFSLNICESDV